MFYVLLLRTMKENKPFNLFRNLHFTELGHTSLLYKLLSKNGKHNMDDLFLRSFIIDVLKGNFVDNLLLEKEVKSGQKGYIDLIISTSDRKIIYCIESKVKRAKDRPNQLYRYWRNHIKKAKEDNIIGDFKLFYITMNGNKPTEISLCRPVVSKNTTKYDGLPDKLSEEDFITLSYKKDIRNWLQYCLKQIPEEKDNLRLIYTLEQYIEWIEIQK